LRTIDIPYGIFPVGGEVDPPPPGGGGIGITVLIQEAKAMTKRRTRSVVVFFTEVDYSLKNVSAGPKIAPNAYLFVQIWLSFRLKIL
jgi:hypothetical protein